MASEVTYLGYRIDSKGLHLTNEKIWAVQSAPEPTNFTELKSCKLIILYYYHTSITVPSYYCYWKPGEGVCMRIIFIWMVALIDTEVIRSFK